MLFWTAVEEQKKSGFRYSYSIYQFEYSRNLLFRTGLHMDQVFEGMIDRTRAKLNFKKVKTIFGRQESRMETHRFPAAVRTRG